MGDSRLAAAVGTVECPHCGAAPDEPCQAIAKEAHGPKSGAFFKPGNFHSARWKIIEQLPDRNTGAKE